MKKNQSTIKVYDATRNTLRSLSLRYELSMCAIVDLLAKQLRDDPGFVLRVPPIVSRKIKSNLRIKAGASR